MKNPTPFDAMFALAVRLHLDVRETRPDRETKVSHSALGCTIDGENRVAYLDRHEGVAACFHELMHLYCDPPGRCTKFNEFAILMPVERAIAAALFPPDLVTKVIDAQEEIRGERLDPFEKLPGWQASLDRAVRAGLLTPGTYAPTFQAPDWSSFSKEELDELDEEPFPTPYVVEVFLNGRWRCTSGEIREDQARATAVGYSLRSKGVGTATEYRHADVRVRTQAGEVLAQYRSRKAVPILVTPSEPSSS